MKFPCHRKCSKISARLALQNSCEDPGRRLLLLLFPQACWEEPRRIRNPPRAPRQRPRRTPLRSESLSLYLSFSLGEHPRCQTAKSTHHPHKIDDQHRECETGGGASFAFFPGSDNSHTNPPPPPPKKYHPMRKVFCGDGAWFAVP